jgi:hypothetical protein
VNGGALALGRAVPVRRVGEGWRGARARATLVNHPLLADREKERRQSGARGAKGVRPKSDGPAGRGAVAAALASK